MTLAQALCHKFTCCFLHLYAKIGQTTDRSDEWSELSVVCPECGCTFGVWRSTLRPHHASARPTGATLAFGWTSGEFQDGQ